MLEAVKCWTQAPRHPARCRTAKQRVLSEVSRVIGGLDPDNGCPGVPEAYWACHIVGQWPRAGLAPRRDHVAVYEAVSLLTRWLLATATRGGAEVDHTMAEQVMAALAHGSQPQDISCPYSVEEVSAVLSTEPAPIPGQLVALCDTAAEQLAVTAEERWLLVVAMMIGDGSLAGAG